MQYSTASNWSGTLDTLEDWIEDDRANPCRVDDVAISQLNWDDVGLVILKPVTIRGHVGGGTRICTPEMCEMTSWIREGGVTCMFFVPSRQGLILARCGLGRRWRGCGRSGRQAGRLLTTSSAPLLTHLHILSCLLLTSLLSPTVALCVTCAFTPVAQEGTVTLRRSI